DPVGRPAEPGSHRGAWTWVLGCDAAAGRRCCRRASASRALTFSNIRSWADSPVAAIAWAMARERDILDRLRRFATDPAARELSDDVALLDGLIITHDTIAEGVHF